jgi:hypothetical protein
MVDSLAAKIGIGEAARRDPVSPSQKTPQNSSLPPQRSVNLRRQLRARSVSESQTAECTRCREIEDALWIFPDVAQGRCGTVFYGLYGSIAGITWLTDHLGIRVCGTRLPREERTGPARGRQCSAIIVPVRCFSQRPSWWENALDYCGGRRQ